MPFLLFALGLAGAYAYMRAFPRIPSPSTAQSGALALVPAPGASARAPYTGQITPLRRHATSPSGQSVMQLPNGAPDSGLAASAVLTALGAAADVVTLVAVAGGGHGGSYGGHGGGAGWAGRPHGNYGGGGYGVPLGYGGWGEIWQGDLDTDLLPPLPPALPIELRPLIDFGLTSGSSAQIAAILNRYGGYPGVRAALTGRFERLRAVGL